MDQQKRPSLYLAMRTFLTALLIVVSVTLPDLSSAPDDSCISFLPYPYQAGINGEPSGIAESTATP